MKYKLTNKTKIHLGKTLYQIEALEDFGDVKKGDKGGWIEKESNLSHFGNCWVYGNAKVTGEGKISDNGVVYGNGRVSGNAAVFGCGRVFCDAKVSGNAKVYGNVRVSGNIDRGYLQFGHYHSKEFNLVNLIDCSLGVRPCNNILTVYKRVNKDLSSEHDVSFIYPEKGIVECEEYEEDEMKSCATGLHFSHSSYYPLANKTCILKAEVHIDDVICCLEGKIRVKKANIIGVCD